MSEERNELEEAIKVFRGIDRASIPSMMTRLEIKKDAAMVIAEHYVEQLQQERQKITIACEEQNSPEIEALHSKMASLKAERLGIAKQPRITAGEARALPMSPEAQKHFDDQMAEIETKIRDNRDHRRCHHYVNGPVQRAIVMDLVQRGFFIRDKDADNLCVEW